MKTTIDDYSAKLVKKILLARSQGEVRLCIDTAIEGMRAGRVDPVFIETFVKRMIYLLDQCNPLFKTAEQWSNIKMARIQFNKLKRSLSPTVSDHL